MVQLYQVPKLDIAGNDEEKELAQQSFLMMRSQGFTLSARTPIRQSLQNLTQRFVELKFKGLEESQLALIIDNALSANPAIFLRETDDLSLIHI